MAAGSVFLFQEQDVCVPITRFQLASDGEANYPGPDHDEIGLNDAQLLLPESGLGKGGGTALS